MKLLKTLYSGCEDNGEVADIKNCIIKFEAGSSGAHPVLLSRYALDLYKIQTLAQEGLITKPYKICVLIRTGLMGAKYSESNKTTIDETIMWWAENLHPPSCGVIYSFYEYDGPLGLQITQPLSTQVIWPFKKSMQAKRDGDYITYQKYPDALKGRFSQKYLDAMQSGQVDVMDRIEELSTYKVIEITYAMSDEEIAELLKHSKMHFTYDGGTYAFAACTNTPTVCFGAPTHMSHPSNWWEDGDQHQDSVQITIWSNIHFGARIPATRVGGYDFEKETVVQRPQRYMYHANTPLELESIIKGFPFTVSNIEYSVDD